MIGYIFISPFILGFFFWFLGPTVFSGWLSMTDWNLISPPKFVGLQNFQRLFNDKLLLQSLKVTSIYTFVSVPLGLVLGFLLALLMNTRVRGIRAFRTIYYMPSIVPAVANAVLWAWIFNTEYGLLNAVLRALGFAKISWLIDTRFALPAIILMGLWGVGGGMVIYLAGLQGIPEVYYEAAEIDGAGRWQRMIHITIPLMSPVLFFNLIMGIIGSFQVFTAGYLLTDGGPQNSTLFYVLYLYRVGFRNLEMGYAATLGWLLFFIILVLTLIVFRYIGRNVYYEEAK
ncbi:MAG TPA: ABC transporter permease [Anaerolinea thermolimosa]|uniref:ABC transporter permease n=1 Tax=Anaerolinea thermolimosa TaxID=229919 RepID=A0A3D1JH29_9CHLR|nr:ABC transporter permease [Anaerolinea thermolimosa]